MVLRAVLKLKNLDRFQARIPYQFCSLHRSCKVELIGLYAILARDARVGVVFRREPSKQVLLLLWRTDTDRFYEGQ